MLDISDLEVLNYMRHEPQLAKIPFSLISAKSLPYALKTGRDVGASLYLTKPVGFFYLKEPVEKVIDSGQSPA